MKKILNLNPSSGIGIVIIRLGELYPIYIVVVVVSTRAMRTSVVSDNLTVTSIHTKDIKNLRTTSATHSVVNAVNLVLCIANVTLKCNEQKRHNQKFYFAENFFHKPDLPKKFSVAG